MPVKSLFNMNIPRDPAREGREDAPVVASYDRISRWPVMKIERHLVLRRVKKLRPGGILVDVGCGPGYLVSSLGEVYPELLVKGVDINKDMIRQAKANFSARNISFERGDGQELPFEAESVDFIISSGSLHHWENPAKVLSEFHRILKPGGQFLVLDLRRDAPRFIYWFLLFVHLFLPPDIKRVNGAIGSFWSSYTIREAGDLMRTSAFKRWEVEKSVGWLFISGMKERDGDT